MIVACGTGVQRGLTLAPPSAPPRVRDACALAEIRCSSCHTLERITSSPYRTEPELVQLIDKMRLMPASGISNADASEVLACLAALSRPTPPVVAPPDAPPPVRAPDAAPPPPELHESAGPTVAEPAIDVLR